MASIKSFKTDSGKEEQGVWINAGGDLRLKIARMGNPAYTAYIKKHSKALVSSARRGEVDLDEATRINKDAAARHILLGWENLTEDEEGKQPIVYSVEKCRELLDIKDFYSMVMEYANDMTLFRADPEQSKGN
jgi:hypothetical protein